MSEGYLYPTTLDTTTRLTPEVEALWRGAWSDLVSRRNKALLWQIPVAVVLFLVLRFAFQNLPGETVLFCFLLLPIPTILTYFHKSTFDYSVSDDRRSAKLVLKRRWRSIGEVISEEFNSLKDTGSHSLEGCFVAVSKILVAVMMFPLFMIYFGILSINRIFWLADFREMADRHLNPTVENSRTHVRGTNILPSVVAAGAGPGRGDSIPENGPILEVLNGKIQLLSNGNVVAGGGVTFDANKVLEEFQIDGLTLSRADVGLLKVIYNGEKRSYFFNGSSWSEV